MKIGFSLEGPHDDYSIPILAEKVLGRPFQSILRKNRSTQKVKEDLKDLEREDIDLIILVKDNDNHNTNDFYKRLEKMASNIRTKLIIAIPVQALEAWLLADENALSKVFGKTINRVKSPEKYKKPKSILQKIAHPDVPTRNHYKLIAQSLSISILQRRCKSFYRFKKSLLTT